MKWILRIFEFYVNSSVHVSFAVISLLLITTEFLNILVSEYLLYFVFFATISSYNFLKYGSEFKSILKKRGSDMRFLFYFSILCLLLACLLSLNLPPLVLPLMGVLLVLLILYIAPVFPRDRNLRSLGLLKVVIVAISWTGVTVLLPVVSSQTELSWDILVLSVQRFLLILAMMIPFEIRDMYFDPPGIKTLPRKFGIRRTKQIGVLLALISFLLVYLKDEIHPLEISSRILITAVLGLLIVKTPTYPSRFYASFWVEGLPVLWLLLINLLSSQPY